MTLYVVLEGSGGWEGVDVYHNCRAAFFTEEAAQEYVKECSDKYDEWTGQVCTVFLRDAYPTL